jgi:molecular chaperone GrpE
MFGRVIDICALSISRSMENKTEELNSKKSEEAVAEKAEQEAPADENSVNAATENSVQADIAKYQAELAENKDKFLRLYSEFENFRRRTAKEKLEMIVSANEQLLISLLPVADDFERAEKSFKEKTDKDSEGFILIQNKFKKILEQYGVKLMDVQKGSDFDADLHEAITQVPAPEDALKGKVVDVVEKGYLLNEKVIRYAKVVVGN